MTMETQSRARRVASDEQPWRLGFVYVLAVVVLLCMAASSSPSLHDLAASSSSSAATFSSFSLLPVVTVVSAAYLPPSMIKLGAVLPLSGSKAGAGYRAWQLLNQSLADLPTALAGVLPATQLQLIVEDSADTLGGTIAAVMRLGARGAAAVLMGSEGLNLISNNPAIQNFKDAALNLNDTTGVDLKAMSRLLLGAGIGDGSAQASLAAWAAMSLDTPLLSVGISSAACASVALGDKELYPYMLRMCIPPTPKAQSMLAVFDAFGWDRMAIVAQDSNDGWGGNMMANADPIGNIQGPGQNEANFIIEQMIKQAGTDKLLLRFRIPATRKLAMQSIPNMLRQIKDSGYRIIVLYVQGDLLVQMMRTAASMGMTQYPYVWVGAGSYAGPSSAMGMGTGTVASGGVGIGLCSQAMISALSDISPAVPSVDASAGTLISSFQSSTIGADSGTATFVYQADLALTSSPLLGAICLSPAAPRSPEFADLTYKLNDSGLPFESILNGADAVAHDSVLVMATVFDTLIRAQVPHRNGVWSIDDVWSVAKQVSLPTQGLVQNLQFDLHGDRIGNVEISNYDPFGGASGVFVRRGVWNQASGNLTITDAIIWSDGTTNLPPDHVDAFSAGEVLSPSTDGRIAGLAYAFILLPALVFTYNARSFI